MLAPRIVLLPSLLLLLLAFAAAFLFGHKAQQGITTTDLSRPPGKVPEPASVSRALKDDARITSPQGLTTFQVHARKLFAFSSPAERLELMRLLQLVGQQGIGSLPLLKEALGHEDQDVRRAAMRGLAATQSPEAIALLKEYLNDGMAIEESTEAALALATMDSPDVTPLLERSLEESSEPVLREHIVDALVSRPAPEVAAFIDSFLVRTDVAVEEKQNLLRMAGLNNTKPSEFLAAYLQKPDESLRLGSYQGLALISESRQTQALLPKLALETDPYNRGLVYEALGNQLDASPAALASLADSEKDDYVQLRALKSWTESASRQNLPLAADPGSATRIAKLQEAALNHDDFAERRVALFALGFARNNPAAREAIERIAQDSGSEKIRALASGLLSDQR
jgi:HEAT repeat protein